MTAVRAATALLSLLLGRVAAEKVFIPPAFHNGSVTIETDSVAGNLDGFKMRTAANRTSYDYWWFDAVSLPDKAGLNIVFYNAGDIGNPQPLAAEISGVFPNGTRFYNQVMASEGAVISNGPQGVSGDWKGTGAKFRGTNLDKPNVEYHVTFDSPGLGVDGTIQLKSVRELPHVHLSRGHFTDPNPAARPSPLGTLAAPTRPAKPSNTSPASSGPTRSPMPTPPSTSSSTAPP
jgi:hypothetical protein